MARDHPIQRPTAAPELEPYCDISQSGKAATSVGIDRMAPGHDTVIEGGPAIDSLRGCAESGQTLPLPSRPRSRRATRDRSGLARDEDRGISCRTTGPKIIA